MSPVTGRPVPTPPEDDFLARLRRTADDAVPPSELDLDLVLRSSRRGVQRRRSLAGVAGVVALGLVGTGVVTAGGPDRLRDLAREVVTGSPGYEVVTAEATAVDLAHGVVAVEEPATYLREDGTYVLDLGLGAWRDGERFLVEYAPGSEAEGVAPTVRVVAGDDADLRGLLRGEAAGTVLRSGSLGMSVVERVGGHERLVVGLSLAHVREGDLWAVLAGEVSGASGATVSTLAVPTTALDGGTLYAMLLGTPSAEAPDVRGMTSYDARTWSNETCDGPMDAHEGGFSTCRSDYDPVTGRAGALLRTSPPADPAVLSVLRSVRDERSENAADVYVLLEACLDVRGEPVPGPGPLASFDVPPGVDGDTWRQCLMDTALVDDEYWRDYRAAHRSE